MSYIRKPCDTFESIPPNITNSEITSNSKRYHKGDKDRVIEWGTTTRVYRYVECNEKCSKYGR